MEQAIEHPEAGARERRAPARPISRVFLTAVAAIACLAAACEAHFTRGEGRIPDEIRAAQVNFIESLHRRDFATLEASFAPEAWTEETMSFLVPFSEGFAAQREYEVKLGIYRVAVEEGAVFHTLGSQVSAGGFYHAFMITHRELDGSLSITGARFDPLPGDLEEIHRVTLAGKGPVLWAVFFAALAFPAFVLWSLYDCWKSRQKLRWLWIPVIVLCFPLLAVMWTTGQATLSLRVLAFGADYFQPSRLSPATIAIAPPLGAIAWHVWRWGRRALGPREPGPEADEASAGDA
jgi:hypothetical protein